MGDTQQHLQSQSGSNTTPFTFESHAAVIVRSQRRNGVRNTSRAEGNHVGTSTPIASAIDIRTVVGLVVGKLTASVAAARIAKGHGRCGCESQSCTRRAAIFLQHRHSFDHLNEFRRSAVEEASERHS